MEIDVENITKSYDKKKIALDQVSFVLSPGVYGLLGPNGAGKSTLINIMVGNLKATSGAVRWDGKDIRKLGAVYRDVIGYMPQQQVLYDTFTGEEFLWYMGALKGIPRKELRSRIKELLLMVNLYDQRNIRISHYSGGMKQRILIAQALLNDPKILIMDEPTAGLDPSERIRIRNFLSTISQDKIILIATHIVSDIEAIAKEILLLRDGKLLRKGKPEVLLQEIRGKVFEVKKGIGETLDETSLCIANIRVEENEKTYRIVSDKGMDGNNVKQVAPGLEELYLYYFLESGKEH
jgi:ABC-type multidrug transport system ATPase subunit